MGSTDIVISMVCHTYIDGPFLSGEAKFIKIFGPGLANITKHFSRIFSNNTGYLRICVKSVLVPFKICMVTFLQTEISTYIQSTPVISKSKGPVYSFDIAVFSL